MSSQQQPSLAAFLSQVRQSLPTSGESLLEMTIESDNHASSRYYPRHQGKHLYQQQQQNQEQKPIKVGSRKDGRCRWQTGVAKVLPPVDSFSPVQVEPSSPSDFQPYKPRRRASIDEEDFSKFSIITELDDLSLDSSSSEVSVESSSSDATPSSWAERVHNSGTTSIYNLTLTKEQHSKTSFSMGNTPALKSLRALSA